jgi:hypothetical protein
MCPGAWQQEQPCDRHLERWPRAAELKIPSDELRFRVPNRLFRRIPGTASSAMNRLDSCKQSTLRFFTLLRR